MFGGVLPGADSGCAATSAELAVGDGYQEVICGCQETGGTQLASGGTPLTCTVPAGTTIFLFYLNTQTKHQVVATVDSPFPSSDLNDPFAKTPMRSYGFKLDTPGTYGYVDAYNTGIAGQIVVQ